VIVEVGPEGLKYHVQAAFLTHYSEYFSKALNGPWKEAEDKVVRLVDIDPDVFSLFIEWLYTQNMPSDEVLWANKFDPDDNMWKIQLYVFADRFAVLSLRTSLNRKISLEDFWPHAAIIYAFDNLPPTNPILDLFVDLHYATWTSPKRVHMDPVTMHNLPKDFLMRFYQRVGYECKRGTIPTKNFELDRCSYHGHVDDKDKASCWYGHMSRTKKRVMSRLDRNKVETDDDDDG